MTDTERPRRMRATDAVLTRGVAPGVHRLTHAYVNCYLLESSDGITVVDAAHPTTWPLLGRAIAALGRRTDEVRAVVLTHAHFDHLGVARRAQREWGVPVLLHREDRYIAAHPYRYAHERLRAPYPLRHPRGVPPLLAMARAGAFRVPGIEHSRSLESDEVLDVPGSPRVVFCPGHTYGHAALLLPDASALLTGDALVTFNPYTGRTGPQIVSGAATADSGLALDSLAALAETDAQVVLPGHGDAWRGGIRSAVEEARRTGRS